MKKRIITAAFVAAIAIFAGTTVYNAQKPEAMSDIALANVEALADPETSDEYTKATCCKAVWESYICHGCDGRTYSYSIRTY